MYKKYVLQCGFAIIIIMIILNCIAVGVFAHTNIDVQKETSLTVLFETEARQCEGATFRLYHVANVSSAANFILTEMFRDTKISFEGLRDEQWKVLAQKLSEYITTTRTTIIPVAEQRTDEKGVALFSHLQTGLYLVVGEEICINQTIYTPVPFLVCLPDKMEGEEWSYEKNAVVKYTLQTVPAPEETPPTGDYDRGWLWKKIAFCVIALKLTWHCKNARMKA